MTRFPIPGHLASRCGRTALDKQSGVRQVQRRHKRGNKYACGDGRQRRTRDAGAQNAQIRAANALIRLTADARPERRISRATWHIASHHL